MKLQGSVLLAEDNVDSQILIQHYVTSTGASLDIVDNGRQAVETINQKAYDLVLMDRNMPVLDGLAATRELRQAGFSKVIIALTADDSEQQQQECIDAGCDGFMSKPVNKDEFLSLLQAHLARNQQA